MKSFLFVLLSMFFTLQAAAWQDFQHDLDLLGRELTRAVPDFPGFTMAVVRGPDTFVTAHGISDPSGNKPATPDTPYYVASVTKPVVGLMALLLDREGIIDLDVSLADAFSNIAFRENIPADRITLRQLLDHTHGLSNDALTFRLAYSGAPDVYTQNRLLASTRVNTDAPPGTFDYSNLGYNILGILIERRTGTPWQDLIHEYVLGPAGMEHSTAWATAAQAWNPAVPMTSFGESGLEALYLRKRDNTMQSAGGMYMSVADAARFLTVQLNKGRVDGEQVFPEKLIERSQHMTATVDAEFGPFKRTGYGVGWYAGPFNDHHIIHHFGGFAGSHAHISFEPASATGVAILFNETNVSGQVAAIMAAFAYDWPLDAARAMETARNSIRQVAATSHSLAERYNAQRHHLSARSWTLSRPAEEYMGVYLNAEYDAIYVRMEGETPVVRMGNLHARATAFTRPDTIRLELIPGEGRVITFFMGDAGQPEALEFNGARFERQ